MSLQSATRVPFTLQTRCCLLLLLNFTNDLEECRRHDKSCQSTREKAMCGSISEGPVTEFCQSSHRKFEQRSESFKHLTHVPRQVPQYIAKRIVDCVSL